MWSNAGDRGRPQGAFCPTPFSVLLLARIAQLHHHHPHYCDIVILLLSSSSSSSSLLKRDTDRQNFSAAPCKNCTTSSSSSSLSPLCHPFIASSTGLLIFIIMIIPAAEGYCNMTQLAHASIALFRLQPGLPQL